MKSWLSPQLRHTSEASRVSTHRSPPQAHVHDSSAAGSSRVTCSVGLELPNMSEYFLSRAPSRCVRRTSSTCSTQPLFSAAVGALRFGARLDGTRLPGLGCWASCVGT